MKQQLQHIRSVLQEQGIALIKWFFFSSFIGIVVGIVGAAFHHSIVGVTALRETYPWLLFLLPIMGVGIVWSYQAADMERDRGTNFVLIAVRENESMRLRTAPLIFLATVLTHFGGGSSGREGAALQLGGSISSAFGHFFKLSDWDARVITMCGMAAGFGAVFGTPLTAAIFAMEVISVGVMYYAALFPCVWTALLAHEIALRLGGETTAFPLSEVPIVSFPMALRVIALGCLCAVLAVLFCNTLGLAQRMYQRWFPSPYIRVIVGGCIVIAITLLLGTRAYNGTGMPIIEQAIQGQARPEAFILKIILTALTLGAGFKGGEIVPVFFIGATFGCFYGNLMGLPASFAAGLGMTAVFCGATNCPLTSILLAYELFGGKGLSFFALICAVSYMMSGYTGLYSEQKIVYSKLHPQFINQKAIH